jgi:GNAT superfamily N-acetyltransferase
VLQRIAGSNGSELPAPEGFAELGDEGVEAMTELADGRVLLIAKGGPGASGEAPAWVSSPAGTWGEADALTPAWTRLGYRLDPSEDGAACYRPTGAAALPEGGLVVLELALAPERRGQGRARLRRWSAEQLELDLGADRLEGGDRLPLGSSVPIENYEAIAVWEEDGRTLVLIASDDNRNWERPTGQRTLIQLFQLVPAEQLDEPRAGAGA